jgi:hypothetical protein
MDKFFLSSKTIIGAILVAIAAFNIQLPITNDEVNEFLSLAEKVFGLILVVYGRWNAEKPLGWRP